MVTDPVADLITRASNAQKAGKAVLSMPHSQLKESIAHILKKAGYFSSVDKKGSGIAQTLEIGLIYINGEPRINGVFAFQSHHVVSIRSRATSVRSSKAMAILSIRRRAAF